MTQGPVVRIWDRGHRPWLTGTLVAGLAGYAIYHWGGDHSAGFRSGHTLGLWFGIVGTGLMLFAAALSVRRSIPAAPWGTLRWWLRAHIWLGLLSGALIALHAGFSWGGGVEFALCVSLILVLLSGLWGWCAQEWVPRLLTMEVPRETFREQHEYQCRWLQLAADRDVARLCGRPLPVDTDGLRPFIREFLRRREADKEWLPDVRETTKRDLLLKTYVPDAAQGLIDAGGYKASTTARPVPGSGTESVVPPHGPSVELLQKFYVDRVRPFLEPRVRGVPSFATTDQLLDEFHQLALRLVDSPLTGDVQGTLSRLELACHSRLQWARQARLHNWLHGWLAVHIPATIATLVLLLVHVVMALRVVPLY